MVEILEILEMHDCMEAGSRTTHDYRDVGGKVTPGAVSEEIKSRIQFPVRHQISQNDEYCTVKTIIV